MINHTQRMIAVALLASTIGAVSSCHSEEAQPLAFPTSSQPTPSPQTSSYTSSLVGTVPVSRSDEKTITPTETVGAASY